MKKIFIFFMVLFIIPFATAAYNDTVPIFADYKIDGILSPSNAYINIIDKEGLFIINNLSMSEISVGRFNYNYTCNSTAEYNTLVTFYDKSTSDIIGTAESSFTCGNSNKLDLTSCPTSNIGIIGMWIFLVLLLIVGLAGAIIKIPALCFLSGIILFFYSITTWGCGDIISYFSILLGVIFMGVGLSIRS